MEQRAREVELRVVQQYGSAAQQYAFTHPHTVPPGVKKPKFPKNPQGPEDMREWMDYAVYSMEPGQIFAAVFQLGLYERYLKGALAGQTAAERRKQRATAVAGVVAIQASQGLALVGGLAGGALQPLVAEAIQAVAQHALAEERASEEERRAAAEGLALAGGLQVFLRDHLSAEEMASYAAADARERAARLMAMTDQMLERQGVPGGYAIAATQQLAASSSARDAALEQLRAMAGDDARLHEATWSSLTQFEQWQAVTEALHRVLRDGEASMGDAARAEAFLARVRFPADRSGSSAVLGTFGPGALPKYRKASSEERHTMELDARVLHVAAELLARVSLGDEIDG